MKKIAIIYLSFVWSVLRTTWLTTNMMLIWLLHKLSAGYWTCAAFIKTKHTIFIFISLFISVLIGFYLLEWQCDIFWILNRRRKNKKKKHFTLRNFYCIFFSLFLCFHRLLVDWQVFCYVASPKRKYFYLNNCWDNDIFGMSLGADNKLFLY